MCEALGYRTGPGHKRIYNIPSELTTVEQVCVCMCVCVYVCVHLSLVFVCAGLCLSSLQSSIGFEHYLNILLRIISGIY